MAIRKSTPERFWSKVIISGPDNCWEWTASKCGPNRAYGLFYLRGRGKGRVVLEVAHRTAWRLTKGPIPDATNVCHRCDNPGCVNPRHLFLGTQKENIQDCISKGRFRRARGRQKPNARLTPDLVRMIRNSPKSTYQLAAELGMGKTAIWKARVRETWAHVE